MLENIIKLNQLKNVISSGDSKKVQEKYEELLKQNDTELLNLIKGLITMDQIQAIQTIDNYIEKVSKEKEEPKEEISRIFGIDVSEIEHKTLDTGVDLFIFYDTKLGRKRFIENPKNSQSLTQQLKEIQNTDEYYQSDKDYKDNANSILKSFPYELEMIDIVDINNYEQRINGLDERERKKLDKLLKNKDINNIRYVNLENSVALSQDGSVIESVILENPLLPASNEVRLESPKEWNYSADEIDNKENVDSAENAIINGETDIDTNEVVEMTENDFEDIPELVEAELAVKNYNLKTTNINEIKENIKRYYKNPDLMINLPENEREFYEKFVTIVSEKIEAKNVNNNKLQYKYEQENKGFLNIIFASILVIIIVIVIVFIMLNI